MSLIALFFYILVVNCGAGYMLWLDRRAEGAGLPRISLKTLHWLIFAGGSIAAFWAMSKSANDETATLSQTQLTCIAIFQCYVLFGFLMYWA